MLKGRTRSNTRAARQSEKKGKIRGVKFRKTFKAGQKLNGGGRRSLYKDYKAGGSVITERLYIDIKQDLKNIKKKITFVGSTRLYSTL